MVSDELETRKTGLENRLDSLGSWMIGFIWPVAIGLFMEFYAILGVPVTRDWNSLIDRIGLLLVTAGVSGELLIEHKTHATERKLRAVNSEIERKSESALKIADERIGLLGKEAEEARLETAKAQLELARNIDRVARQARRRMLSNGFHEAVNGKPSGIVHIWFVLDVEAFSFAVQIWRGFLKHGWRAPAPKVIELSTDGSNNPLRLTPDRCNGMNIVGRTLPDGESADSLTNIVYEAINAAIADRNWTYAGLSDPNMPEGSFAIIVGRN